MFDKKTKRQKYKNKHTKKLQKPGWMAANTAFDEALAFANRRKRGKKRERK